MTVRKYSVYCRPSGYGRGHFEPGGWFISWLDYPRGSMQIDGYKTKKEAEAIAEQLLKTFP